MPISFWLKSSVLAAAAAGVHSVLAANQDCSALAQYAAQVETESIAVTSAVQVPANATTELPAYCGIESVIGGRIGVWMKFPDNWNGRYYQVGCGGLCGTNPLENTSLNYRLRNEEALRLGYALATTNMGNPSPDKRVFRNHNLQARIDWGHLATHLTAIASKDLLEEYYGKRPVYSYHIGSSTGGRQGLVEAQRYPEDFDGIVATVPAFNETAIITYHMTWAMQALVASNGTSLQPIATQKELAVLSSAVLRACDELDGLEDGIITDPRACDFKLSSIVCPEGTTNFTESGCISRKAAVAMKKLYQGPVNSNGDRLVLEGLLPGSESDIAFNYGLGASGSLPGYNTLTSTYLSNLQFYPDPVGGLTPWEFDMDTPLRDTAYMESMEYGGISDLQKFSQLGSKLIILQGLEDAAVPPWLSRDYYHRAIATAGGRKKADEFMRYYEMSGVGHSSGPGGWFFSSISYIAPWVENGTAPYEIIGSNLDSAGKLRLTRPHFPYPYLPYWDGKGDPNKASSFVPKKAVEGFRHVGCQ